MENELTFTATYSAAHEQNGIIYLSVTLTAQSMDQALHKAEKSLRQAGYQDLKHITITTATDDQPLGIHPV